MIAKRRTRRIEIVQEHSKTNISLMFRDSADEKLLPPNSTLLLQPLDVAVFRTVKAKWKIILQNFRRESRATGPIPMQSFGIMLFQLWKMVENPYKLNLNSGFRACGLSSLNRDAPLRRLIGSETHCEESIGRDLRPRCQPNWNVSRYAWSDIQSANTPWS